MRVLVDANFLIHLIDHGDSATQANKERHEKLKGVVNDVVAKRGLIVVPTPVLTEYLLNAGEAGSQIVARLLANKWVIVASFDEKAAHTCAGLHRSAKAAGGHKRAPMPQDADW